MVVRTFDDRLRKALKDKNITQRQLARMTGLSESLISSYCRGIRTPRMKNARILACALGVTEEWLAFGMEEEI